MLLHTAIDLYVRNHVVKFYKHAGEAERRIQRHLKQLPDVELSGLERVTIIEFHAKIGRHYPALANRCLKDLRAMYNRMVEWGKYSGANPTQQIQQFKPPKRTIVLNETDLAPLLRAIYKERPIVQIYFLTILLTGVRRDEARTMQQHHLDMASGRWTLPMTKNGQPHRLLLPKALADLFRLYANKEGYIFSVNGKRPWAVATVENFWSRIRCRARLEHVTLHDLRRTLITSLWREGVPVNIIQGIVNHSRVGTTEGYVVKGESHIVGETLAHYADRVLNAAAQGA